MIIPFACPACQHQIEAELKGLKRRVVSCPSCKEQVQVPDDLPIGPGVVIGNGYKLEQKIAESSLGDVYLATKSDGRQYTVEILSGEMSRDQEKVTRLMQETDLVVGLKHPNIVEAVEAGQDNDSYFLVTAYESGTMLNDHLDQNGALTCGEALNISIGIAEALRYAWEEKKILHRDIKPQSIFLTDNGVAKLMGFGIAKSSEGQSLGLTGIGFTIGTPEYMSPEQIQAAEDLDFRADLYSLGIVLYECVTGTLPFEETAPVLLMQKQMDEKPEPARERNANVTPAVSALIDKMLMKSRSDRHSSWKALIDDMKKAMNSADVPGSPNMPAPAAAPAGTPAGEPTGKSNKNMLMIVGFTAVIVILLIVIIVLATR